MGPGPLPAEVDVLVVGAGLSGVGVACHLQARAPGWSFAIVEARGAIGGTWDLFRYPGVRSDSDMFTLGYAFRPWRGGRALADGPSIRQYIVETAAEAGVDQRIWLGHRLVRAAWSSAEARWTVHLAVGPEAAPAVLRCRVLFTCTGYYRYSEGYTPDWAGVADFGGLLVHPQAWPEGLPVAGRRVVVVGSGATAVTLVPALAAEGAEVVMLQRTPTYVVSQPAVDRGARALEAVLPAGAAWAAARWKNIARNELFFRLSRRFPGVVRRVIEAEAARQVGPAVDAAQHFHPPYAPWDQRLCVVPDGDLFAALRSGAARVVTGRIARFVPAGVELESGAVLEADIVVAATGLQMRLMDGVSLTVDGAEVALARCFAFKGMMYSGVPNLIAAFGYTNNAWTLKVDLVAGHACRLLAHLRATGADWFVAEAPEGLEGTPLVDLQSGYVARAQDGLPRQGPAVPWRLHQSYLADLLAFRFGPVADPALRFGRAGGGVGRPASGSGEDG
jgi:cation diffusion facilitator CzcD-associated flavoprotein CzcO